MSAWVAVLLAGLGSFAFRFGVVAVVDRFTLPHWFERASTYVMPASFAGLACVALLGPVDDGAGEAVPVLAGALVTVAIARRRPAHLAMLGGLAVLWAADLALAELVGAP